MTALLALLTPCTVWTSAGACVAASADDYKHDDYKHKPHKYENEPKAKSMCNMRNKYE